MLEISIILIYILLGILTYKFACASIYDIELKLYIFLFWPVFIMFNILVLCTVLIVELINKIFNRR